ncbi:caveolin-1-like isoform X1 [Crassostrea angulata]|uniref:caveolin-1-like n=1 Tax=Magallana gigas TaxID=29159 RepID=UPI0022B115BE|nr:caveolin-1-like isoform X1 [Crassostrea angulata]
MATGDLDLFNRDPNEINSHIKVAFEDVLAEPDGIQSNTCVWTLSNLCFRFWRSCTYKLMTLTCGMCIAMYWGCEFSYIAFMHIWYVTPCLRILEINCVSCQKIYALCINCWIVPFCEACGSIFINFKRK